MQSVFETLKKLTGWRASFFGEVRNFIRFFLLVAVVFLAVTPVMILLMYLTN